MIIHTTTEMPDRLDEVVKFINQEYQRRLGATPPPSNEYLFALEDGKVTATAGIDLAIDGKMVFENWYKMESDMLPAWYSRESVVLYSKFASVSNTASAHIIYYAANYGLRKGCMLGISILNKAMQRYYKGRGIIWSKIPGATLNLEAVEPEVAEYFHQESKPELFAIPLLRLQEPVKDLVCDKHIKFANQVLS